jgi:23S rRNA (pseudouridine1915-N3)-methyltransferase
VAIKIKLFTVGKLKQDFVTSGKHEYLPRLKRQARFEFVEIDARRAQALPLTQRKAAEGELLLKQVSPRDCLIALDSRGKTFSSENFAAWIQAQANAGTSSLAFAIGGSDGFDKAVLSRANLIMSLSTLTFSYQLSALVLMEQIYRAFSILEGTAYHK